MSGRLIQVASSNRGKLSEILLGVELWQRKRECPLASKFELLPDFASLPRCEETEDTFLGNARKKALHYARHSRDRGGTPHALVLADDSGLLVSALSGRPGIFSARFAGPNATDADNNVRLLREMAQIPPEHRTAMFVCALALAGAEGLKEDFSGVAHGDILQAPRGSNGFGYDPLFLDTATGKTYAELTSEEKLARSHRGKALFALLDWLASEQDRNSSS